MDTQQASPPPFFGQFWEEPSCRECSEALDFVDQDPVSSSEWFSRRLAEQFRFISECNEKRRMEYVRSRMPDDQDCKHLEQNVPPLFEVPHLTIDTIGTNDNKVESLLIAASNSLWTIVVYNDLVIRDEVNHEESTFAESFREMARYYTNCLDDLSCEMAARNIPGPDFVDYGIIPEDFRRLEGDRSARHDRDYCIMRDVRRVLCDYARLFEDLA